MNVGEELKNKRKEMRNKLSHEKTRVIHGQKVELFNVNRSGTQSSHWALKGLLMMPI